MEKCKKEVTDQYHMLLKEASSKSVGKGRGKSTKNVESEAQKNTCETRGNGEIGGDDGGEEDRSEEGEDWTEEEDAEEEEEEEGYDDDDDVGRNSRARRSGGYLRSNPRKTEKVRCSGDDVDLDEEEELGGEPDSTSSYHDEEDYDIPDMQDYSNDCQFERIRRLYHLQWTEIECLLQKNHQGKTGSAALKKELGIDGQCVNGNGGFIRS